MEKINNLSGALIQTNGSIAPTIIQEPGSNALTLLNAGTIMQTSAQDTVTLQDTFLGLTNNSGGLITQTGGGAFAVIDVLGGGNGAITNNAGAVISATVGNTDAILIKTLPFGGIIDNKGTISSVTGAALNLQANVLGAITNSGTILSSNPSTAAILATGVLLKGGITNTGLIQSSGANPALNLVNSGTTLNQLSGNIVGDVLLASIDSNNISPGVQNVLNFQAGTILGDVTAATFGANTNLLQLNGGTLNGLLTLGNNGDTVNLSGTQILGSLLGGTGNDTINVIGGNFALLDGNVGFDTLNILKSFTPNGPIANIDLINVNPGTVLTLLPTTPITGMDSVLPDSGLFVQTAAELVLGGNITGKGSITNGGLLTVVDNPLVNLSTGPGILANFGTTVLGKTDILTITSNAAGAFTNVAGSILKISGDLNLNGLLTVNSNQIGAVNLELGSFILPDIKICLAVNGEAFDIINVVGGGTIIANNSLIQPLSALVSFNQVLNVASNVLSLEVVRTPIIDLALGLDAAVGLGIGGLLDLFISLGIDLDIGILTQLCQLTNPQDVVDAIESLAPPFNYGLIAGSHVGMDTTFDGVHSRIEDLRKNRNARGEVRLSGEMPAQQLAANGMSFGDIGGTGTGWIKVLGANLNQKERHNVDGYRAKGAGIVVGADWGFNDCTTFGLAASYTKVNVDDKNPNPKDQAIKSWQGTGYGWWEFMDGVYLDGIFGVSTNHYKANRVIHVGDIHTGAQSTFNGTQYGARVDLGWDMTCDPCYYFAPFARLQYIRLNLDDYDEAGELGLHVQNKHNNEFLGGVGFKLGSTYQNGCVLLVPELSAMYAYDFKVDAEQTIAGFIVSPGFGFPTNGIKPGRNIFDLGLELRAHTGCSIFTVKYDLELRSKFVANVASLQYNYLWS